MVICLGKMTCQLLWHGSITVKCQNLNSPPVIYEQFEARLKDHRRQANKRFEISKKEKKMMQHDRNIYPEQYQNHRGEVIFSRHPAQKHLRADIESNCQNVMTRSQLHATRPEYQEFKLSFFSKRIDQEIRRHKFSAYLEQKRIKQRRQHGEEVVKKKLQKEIKRQKLKEKVAKMKEQEEVKKRREEAKKTKIVEKVEKQKEKEEAKKLREEAKYCQEEDKKKKMIEKAAKQKEKEEAKKLREEAKKRKIEAMAAKKKKQDEAKKQKMTAKKRKIEKKSAKTNDQKESKKRRISEKAALKRKMTEKLTKMKEAKKKRIV